MNKIRISYPLLLFSQSNQQITNYDYLLECSGEIIDKNLYYSLVPTDQEIILYKEIFPEVIMLDGILNLSVIITFTTKLTEEKIEELKTKISNILLSEEFKKILNETEIFLANDIFYLKLSNEL